MITDILQPTHIIFLLVVALLVLGPKRLPDAARSMGKGIRSFRGAIDGIQNEASSLFNDDEPDEMAVPAATIIEPDVADHEPEVAATEPEPVAPATVITPATVIEPEPDPVAPATVIEPTIVSSTSRADAA